MGVRLVRPLPVIDGAALAVEKTAADEFWAQLTEAGVDRVWLDGQRQTLLDQSVPHHGARAGRPYQFG